MNKRINTVLLLAGVLLLSGSCVPFSYVLYHGLILPPTSTQTMPSATSHSRFQASPTSHARFELELAISTHSVQEDDDSFDKRYKARFNFPLSYRISAADGSVLVQEELQLAWQNGASVTLRDVDIDSQGGTLTASYKLEGFTLPADGLVDLDITIGSDSTYRATIDELQVHLHEGLINNKLYLLTASVLFASGLILFLIGCVRQIVHSAQTLAGEDTGELTATIKQEAMLLHLSALAGYLMPFANVVVPLLLWLIWRKKHPFLDDTGREAVNFQLSLLLYYCVAFVLCFVLIGFLLLFMLFVFHLSYIVIAAMQASAGKHFRYPLCIHFIKV